MTEPFWTDARVDELKTRWANAETFTEIAFALGHRSRNAVIGKAHRLGLRREGDYRPRPKPAKPRQRRYRIPHHNQQGETMTSEDTPPPGAFMKPFIALEATDCHWPGPGIVTHELLCCAAPVLAGYPYCLAHCRIAYNAVPLKRIKVP